jgi:hypothetical protein
MQNIMKTRYILDIWKICLIFVLSMKVDWSPGV